MGRCVLSFLISLSPILAETSLLRGPLNGWVEQAPLLQVVEDATVVATPEGRIYRMPEQFAQRLPVFSSGEGAGDQATVLIRVANDRSAAMRLHFEDFHLSKDVRLFVYGIDADNNIVDTYGPYLLSGPMSSGEFWTKPVGGKTIVVELQNADMEATLPFRLEEVAATEDFARELSGRKSSDLHDAALPGPAERRWSWFRGAVVQHEVIDGMAVWEGDILLGRSEELEPYSGDGGAKQSLDRQAGAVSIQSYRWTGGVIPYTVDPSLPNQARITAAVSHWNTNLAGFVKLIPRTTEPYYLSFLPASPSTCSSYLGMVRMASQPVNIGEYCSTGNVIHEIGHAIGLYHEHTRSDRDGFVRIVTQNLDTSASFNFEKQPTANFGSYDYNSIMHYGAYAFSTNGRATIETIPAGIAIGQRNGLSTGDIAGVKAMYPGSTTGGSAETPVPSLTVAATFTSSPIARPVVVDGVVTPTPKVFAWQSGSTHTISAPNVTENGTRYEFRQWSDGGAQTHVITVPAAAVTYAATYNVLHNLTLRASAGGRISSSPSNADGYYPGNTAIAITATAEPNYCFTSWTGVMAVPSTAIAIALTRPASIQANFQPGAVSVAASVTAPVGGGIVSSSISATSGCLWRATSFTDWIRVENSSGTTSAVLRLQVEPNPNSAARRTGQVLVNSQLITVFQ